MISWLLCPTLTGSKSFCQSEENRFINESSDDSNDGFNVGDNQEALFAPNSDENKENIGKKKKQRRNNDKEFIIRAGKVPLRSIPLNVCIYDFYCCYVIYF